MSNILIRIQCFGYFVDVDKGFSYFAFNGKIGMEVGDHVLV